VAVRLKVWARTGVHLVGRPASALPRERQERLDDGDAAEQVGFELLAPQVQRQHFDRGADLDSGVVDQGAQRALLGIVGDPFCQFVDVPGNGDVQGGRLNAGCPDGISLLPSPG
jgi:hypothetical protein